MLVQLIAALQRSHLDMTAEEIADMLWLASHIKTTQKETDTPTAEAPSQDRDETIVPEFEQSGLVKQTISPPPNADIHPTTHQSDTQSDVRGSLFRSPAAPALPNTLLLARALRPLMRRLPSKIQFVLNQQATVQRIAETDQRIWAPVLEPLSIRRFDIELVVDEGASMLLWQQVVIEWRTLLEHHGAFRNVRTWRITTDDREYIQLYAGTTKRQDHPHDPKELIDPSGRRLILVMTDCVSPAWHSGKAQSLLDIWGHQNLVSLIQVFPRRLWQQTALVNADLIQIDALFQHISNSQLKTQSPAQWFDEGLPEEGLVYPVVTLEYRSLHNWARTIAGTERTWIPGILFARKEVDGIDKGEAALQYALSPERRIQLFHASASPTARRLIELLAAAPIPINLQVIWLIQRTMVPEASQAHIAEVLLSGLLENIYRDPTVSDLNNIEYDFVTGVREELLNAVTIPNAHQVLREISLFFERLQGKARDFLTLITTPNRIDKGVSITHESRPLAQIASTVLRRYGGGFATMAKKLEERILQLDMQSVEEKETSKWGSMVWGRDKWGIDTESIEIKETLDPKNVVEHRRGRILVVDDDPQWRKLLVEILNNEGYIIEAVATTQDALNVLYQGIYHLLIMETRFDDNDESNTDGMTLLNSLKERGLDEATKIIIFSAFITSAQMHIAFRDFNVADVLSKDDFNRQQFLETVHATLNNYVGINLKLDIFWADAGPKQAVRYLQIENELVEQNETLRERAATELEELLRRLFPKAESLIVRQLTALPSRSGTCVLNVQPFYPTGGGHTVMVKFGHFPRIKEEQQHLKEYVQFFVSGTRHTTIESHARTALLGGIVYSLLGTTNEQWVDFGQFYRRSSIQKITSALDRLFHETCGSWYANHGPLRPRNLGQDYCHQYRSSIEQLESSLKDRLTSIERKNGQLHFTSLTDDRLFTDPIQAIKERVFIYATYESITHGDLNQNNILVDNAEGMWLVDFENTERSHILRDVATLDSVVRFQILETEEATLDERLKMEEALLSITHFSQLEHLSSAFDTKNPALAKAYQTTCHLRTLARWAIDRNPRDNMEEYYVALVYNALFALQFFSLSTRQREHAFFSASLLTDKLIRK